MKRALLQILTPFAAQKTVLLSGPRQVGKTTLTQEWLVNSSDGAGLYLNWDIPEHRETILRKIFSAEVKNLGASTLVLDEIHKYHRWKNQLKGLIDRRLPLQIVVTGSARLDVYKKGGDSLLGRYEMLRLHPLTMGEILHGENRPPPVNWLMSDKIPWPKAQETFDRLLVRTGFPEPYFSKDPLYVQRWSARRRDVLINQDLRDLENLKTLSRVEELALLLNTRVGSPLSVNSLREDLGIGFDTVKNWMDILERIYFCFRIPPFAKKIARSLSKEKKLYLWDYSLLTDDGARFENMVALHLLKSVHLWNDLGYGEYGLCYGRTKEKKEVDFIICNKQKPICAIEAKWSDDALSDGFKMLKVEYPNLPCIQLTAKADVDHKTASGVWIVSAAHFLSTL